jgi:hypothetical protein
MDLLHHIDDRNAGPEVNVANRMRGPIRRTSVMHTIDPFNRGANVPAPDKTFNAIVTSGVKPQVSFR